MASTNLTRTFTGGNGGSNWTTSFWIKRSKITLQQDIFEAYSSSTYHTDFLFKGDDAIQFMNTNNGSTTFKLKTNRVFRDVNAWYHIVLQYIASGDSGVYAKIYVNGVQETSLLVNTQGAGGTQWNNDCVWTIGSDYERLNDFDGCISHFHHCDGSVLAPTVFGETDATTGEWKIKTSPSFTLGTNGFTILKDGNIITDQSANSNNWSLASGTLTKTEDSPSNVFATMNPLISQTAGVAGRNNPIDAKFFNGNTTIATSVAYWTPQLGNMEMFSGKYYWEQKFEVDGTPSNYLSWIGIEATDTAGTALGNPSGTNANGIAYGTGGVVNKSGSSQSGSWSTWTAGDIVMCAVDLDNNYIYFGKNGTWQNSGVPTSGGSGTGGVAVTTGKSYITASTIHRGGNYSINTTYSYAKSNFGNGYFGTTAVSSAGTNASGNGIFEFDVPAGYTALSTKGLNL